MTEINVVAADRQSERRLRGRPKGSGLRRSDPTLRAAFWRRIRKEIAKGNLSIRKACEKILSRESKSKGSAPTPLNISLFDVSGRRIGTLTLGRVSTLLRWYHAAEHDRKTYPHTRFARECEAYLDGLLEQLAEEAGNTALIESLKEDGRAGQSAYNGNYREMTKRAERARDRARAAVLARGLKAPKTPRAT